MTVHAIRHPGAERLAFATLADAIRPTRPETFRNWLGKNIILVDGPLKGELWSAADAPYLLEIADCLSVEHPCNQVTVRKAQQTGVSILGLAWSLYLAEVAPDNILFAVPGIDALQDMNSGKLQPLIDEWQKETGKNIIYPTTSRSGVGSTTYEKKFAGGAIYLGNANTVMDLSSKTCRFGVKDEVSKWKELPNGADPETLYFGRFTAFRRTKSYKIFALSTPEIDTGEENGEGPGHCRIDRDFQRSDQRFWNIRCPECGFEQVQFFENLIVDKAHPHRSRYQCENCTHEISESERVVAVRAGRYIATAPGPDREPGFHVDAFISLMMSYEAISEDYLESLGKGEAGAKDFSNLYKALPYAMRGNAPDHQRLMERREDYQQRVIPAECLLFVGAADVQHSGIYAELVAFAEDRQSWTVDYAYFEGATDNPQSGAWIDLDTYWRRPVLDAWGRERFLDAFAVDAGDGGRTNQVLEWCRRRPNTYATKGQPGRGVPAIDVPLNKSVTKRGKRRKYGSARLWKVGTWSLKSELYANLHKTGQAAGELFDPPGYCHFGKWQGEEYFKQITAEYFEQKMVNGRYHEEWKRIRTDNHLLDCRVYAMAMAEHLGLTRMTKVEWEALRSRLLPSPDTDLLSPQAHSVQAAPSAPAEEQKSQASTSARATDRSRINKWKKRT